MFRSINPQPSFYKRLLWCGNGDVRSVACTSDASTPGTPHLIALSEPRGRFARTTSAIGSPTSRYARAKSTTNGSSGQGHSWRLSSFHGANHVETPRPAAGMGSNADKQRMIMSKRHDHLFKSELHADRGDSKLAAGPAVVGDEQRDSLMPVQPVIVQH